MTPLSTPPGQIIFLMLVGTFILCLPVIVVALVTHARTRQRELQILAETRDAMLAKGFDAEEIVKVLESIGRPDPNNLEYDEGKPAPCDVVAFGPGKEWNRALLLAASMDGGQFLVHYAGTDLRKNEWIGRDRVRFPSTFSPKALESNLPPFPFAEPLLVERDEEWLQAYLVTRRREEAYVHFVGEDWEENEWVSDGRMRRAAYPCSGSPKPEPSHELLDV